VEQESSTPVIGATMARDMRFDVAMFTQPSLKVIQVRKSFAGLLNEFLAGS